MSYFYYWRGKMEEIKDLLALKAKKELEDNNLFIDSVYEEKDGGVNYLRIAIDRKDDYIDLDTITLISEVLNKIIDEENIAKDNSVVDIYAKEKGGK